MKYIKLLLFSTFLFILMSCRSVTDCNQMLQDIHGDLESGNLREAINLANSLKISCVDNKQVLHKADSLSQIAERIGLDFSVSEEQVITQIEKRSGSFSRKDMAVWEKKGWLELRLINGEKKYFNRAASNLLLIKKFYEQKEARLREIGEDPSMIFRLKHTEEAYKASDNHSNPVVPVNMEITYTITVHPDAVPARETIRCWLPWPKESHPRQQNIKLLSTSNQEYIIAPDSAIHSTIYMEGVSKKGIPTVFRTSFRYQSYAQYFNMGASKILPYDKTSYNYKKYTSEHLPQICFTENIKRLADSITGKDDNPSAIVRKTYYWFKNNIPWAGALEYSIMPNIPEYVYQNRRGDCGMQTFLFMSMLRYKGVPVRWQSGWMVPPGDKNLHDWCEVYYEGIGWVPVDVSYDLQQSEKAAVKEFYISGIDSYRLIVNDGVAGPLHPEKQFLRSEPFDFQRGEVEWKGGNLYFDKWDYDMKIEYIK
ncbi:MAG: transglutaminase-like domain-containing protein [Bacteroidales bacterium]|nr:transglutaminase-like domain-containing protein [Bacteroidales bacterium]